MSSFLFFTRRVPGWSLCGAAAVSLATAGGAVQSQSRVAIADAMMPSLRPWLSVPEARHPVRLEHLQVRTEVLGSTAQTELEMSFHNPNDRVLEGSLQFPLREGQTVTGFALDIGGEWRDAVPVPKAKGQQVFEDVIRRRIDPALLEVTEGQHYKLRVYPLPAHGTRRVRLTLSETLGTAEAQGRRFDLPLQFGGPVGQMTVQVRLVGAAAQASQVRAQFGAETLTATVDGPDALVRASRSGSSGHGGDSLSVRLPAAGTAGVASRQQTLGEWTYFDADVPVPDVTAPRPSPRQLALLWDASGSGAARDHGKEFALLDAYFATLDELTVHLVVGRDSAEPVRQFQIQRGNWSALRRHLEALPYDGATRLSSLVPPAGTELALLFSDGVSTYGDGELTGMGNVPLYSVQAAHGADAGRLRHAAEHSGGEHLDLQRLNTLEAVRRLRTVRTRITSVQANGAQDLVTASTLPHGGRVRLAGRLRGPQATVVITLQTPQGATLTREWTVAAARGASTPTRPESPRHGFAAKQWAQLQIAAWTHSGRHRHRAAIQRLATEFALPTSETSLIVLDAVDDYAQHDITPPPSLRAAYDTLQAHKHQRHATARSSHLDQVAARFEAEVDWWQRVFPHSAPPARAKHLGRPAPRAETLFRQFGGAAGKSELEDAGHGAAPRPVAPSPMQAPSGARPAEAGSTARTGSAEPLQHASVAPHADTPALPPSATIQLQKWQPNAPYARRLKAAATRDLYAIYLDEKPAYRQSTAFFLDVADLLLARGQTALGLRVLSNLAEMDLQNRHVLRILGHRLLQAQQVNEAITVFEAVRELSPDEPQSWRDLGLAQAQAGRTQAAVDALWEVVSRPWSDRFPDIELTALSELNAIASQAKVAGQAVDLGAIDPRLLRNLPLDLRAVLSWDADNTDIDLWVIDPNGERTFFGNPLSHQGGRISRDFVGGYGPEVFSLRRAKAGTYTVMAQFYGHNQQIVAPATTLMLRLSTGYGTEQQRDQTVTLRLSGQGEQVTVGRFEVKGSTPGEERR
ncbi:MAG: VIT domain-containing protein [Pseudomonadota bacterium]